MYLAARVPCPVNYNPFMMFAPDPDAAYNDQLIRATNFVISCGRFKRALDAEILKPEVFHMNPAKSDSARFRKFCRFKNYNIYQECA
jgi:carnitine O-palmitoyltransferase 2